MAVGNVAQATNTALTVNGASSFNAVNGAINLSNTSNAFNGAVALANTGAFDVRLVNNVVR